VRERCARIASFGGFASYSILQNCVDVEMAAPAASGPPAAGGTARFYLVTSEGGQGTPYNALSECLQARAKATQTAICINGSASADRRCKSRQGSPPRGPFRGAVGKDTVTQTRRKVRRRANRSLIFRNQSEIITSRRVS
jgi:hypothetical protein